MSESTSGDPPEPRVFVARPGETRERPMVRSGARSFALIDPQFGATMLDMHLNVIEGGAAREDAPYHLHTRSENVYFVLEGRLGVRLEDRDLFVEHGCAIFIPPGVPHAVWNAGKDVARLIEIYSPPDVDFVRLDDDATPLE